MYCNFMKPNLCYKPDKINSIQLSVENGTSVSIITATTEPKRLGVTKTIIEDLDSNRSKFEQEFQSDSKSDNEFGF